MSRENFYDPSAWAVTAYGISPDGAFHWARRRSTDAVEVHPNDAPCDCPNAAECGGLDRIGIWSQRVTIGEALACFTNSDTFWYEHVIGARMNGYSMAAACLSASRVFPMKGN